MKYYIKGLDCPNCAKGLEEYIKNHEHVKFAKLNFTKSTLILQLDDEKYFDEIYKDIRKIENVTLSKKELKFHIDFVLLIRLIISVLFLVLGIIFDNLIFYIISYIIISFDIIYRAIINIFKAKFLDERFLMTVASVGAFFIKEYNEACLVMIIYTFGEFLQELAVNKSREKISNLIDLKVNEVRVLENNEIIIKNVEEVKVNEVIEILKGDKIPLDGILLSEEATFNTQSLTGESKFLDAKNNDNILSGYINESDVIYIKVNKEYNDSTVKKIIDMIENSTETKTKTETFITKFSKYYTPIVVLSSVIIFIILFLVNKNINLALNSALIFLVVSCPCALLLSIPLLYFASIGKCSKEGILVKGSTFLDEVLETKNIIFDKTGTLTTGEFIINDYSDDETLNIAANLENYSNHPLAKSISKYLKNKLVVKDFKEIKGKGISGYINNDFYVLGNKKFVNEYNVNVLDESKLYLLKNNEYFGFIKLSDELKVNDLNIFNDYHLVLLSGDNKESVSKIGEQLKIKDLYYSKLPHEKNEIVKQYPHSIYVGDGINDSISLKNADIGVSMGLNGSDAAIEISDVVLINDDLKSLRKFIDISKKTRRIAIFNISFILIFKLLFLILASFNIIGMSLAIFADVGIALICVLNSLRIIR